MLRAAAASRGARGASWAVAVLVCAPAILYLAPGIVGMDEALVVLSGSMAPFFDPGDVIFVETVGPEDVREGTVITFRASATTPTLVTHRVVEVLSDDKGRRYRTQGDANEDPDPLAIPHERVVGAYRFHIPWWGYLLYALRTKVGYVALVLVPGGTVILREFVALYRELDAMDRTRRAASDPVSALLERLEEDERKGTDPHLDLFARLEREEAPT